MQNQISYMIKFSGIKLDPHGEFKLGSKEFWDISKDINSDDEDDVYDPSSRTKRSGPKISVKKSKW